MKTQPEQMRKMLNAQHRSDIPKTDALKPVTE